MSDDAPHVKATLTFDCSISRWYCEVGVPESEPDAQGDGPDPLSAAMNCAERLYAMWAPLRYPGEQPRVLHAEYGWVAFDADGNLIRDRRAKNGPSSRGAADGAQ